MGNTPPEAILDLPREHVEKAAGDALGGFWQPTGAADTPQARARGAVPDPDVRREAYSWGNLARTTVASGGSPNRIGGGLARVGWMLLIPFGLVNVAYWARCLDKGTGTRPHPCHAGTLRLAGLLLTLLLATSVSVVALDLIAVQCAGRSCAVVSGPLGFADSWTVGQRLAAASSVPIVLVTALAALGAATRARYERPDPLDRTSRSGDSGGGRPLLSRQRFWGHQAVTLTAAGVHVSATAALVTVGTAWHFAFGPHPACGRMEDLATPRCHAEAFGSAANIPALVMLSLGLVVLLWSAIVLVRRSDLTPASRRRIPALDRARYVSIAGVSLFVVQLAILAFEPAERQPVADHLVGVSAMPAILLAGLLALSVSALLWRRTASRSGPTRHLPTVLGALFVAGLLTVGFDLHRWWGLIPSAAIGAAIVVWTRGCRDHAWRGTGPGIALMAATVTAMLFSSSVVVVAGDVLNGPAPVTALASPESGTTDGALGEVADGSANLLIPLPYTWFGAAAIPALLLLAAVVGVSTLRSSRWRRPSAADPGDSDSSALRAHRRIAAAAQRAEGYVAALALLGGAAASAALVLSVADASLAPGAAVRGPVGAGIWLMAMVGLALGVTALFRGAAGSTRPVGLVWDLICFLPRGGHPLAPPCYAERVVPEVAWRCREWLESGDEHEPQRRTVVLSAHSLGSVLAVAVILSPILTDAQRQRLSLITYGSQLRAYFGRIFPELIGPTVVGYPAGTAPSLLSTDPWRAEHRLRTAAPTPGTGTMCSALTDDDGTLRWRNLWRRTDYIGFPVWGYPTGGANPVDRAAEEIDDTGYLNRIATHSAYPRSRAYRTALRELCDRATLDPSSAGTLVPESGSDR